MLAELFGAQLHHVGCPPSHWGELEIAREQLTAHLEAQGAAPHSIPIGGSTAVGALGYVVAYIELVEQCRALGMRPRPSCTRRRAAARTPGWWPVGRGSRSLGVRRDLPDVLAIGVAKGVVAGQPDVRSLALDVLALLGVDADVGDDAVEVDPRWLGADYGVPTPAGDEAIRWAALHGGWVLDRTYTGKGFAGLLGNAATGRWRPGAEVVFLHTGGLPAVFTDDGTPG